MASLARQDLTWPKWPVAQLPYDTPPERLRLAKALALLRTRAGMTQAQAAERINRTVQAWQNYEWGKRRFTTELVAIVTKAVDATPEELLAAREEIDNPDDAPRPVASHDQKVVTLPVLGRVRAGSIAPNNFDLGEPEVIDFSGFFGPDARVLRLAGESMVPYAEPGGFVTYHLTRWPRRNQGCVIETVGGEYYVKRYDYERDGKLFVTELHPVERQLEFDLTEIKGVYAIGLRGD